MMPRILSVGTAVPEHVVHQRDVMRRARHHFAGALTNIERLLSLFQRTGIETRHLCMPVAWYEEPHSFETRNRLYVEHALALSRQAAAESLARSGTAAAAVDAIFFVSSTGLATPSLDARLAQELGLPGHVDRTPIWGLGCAGGAAGLARAHHYVRAYPGRRALVVAVELCSLTFQPQDRSKRNLVAAALFADGAAAVMVAGDESAAASPDAGCGAPAVLASASRLWPDTTQLMGWDVTGRGLEVVFSRRIPVFVRREVREAADRFLAPWRLTLAQVDRFILHPGGTRVLEAYAQAWELPLQTLAPAPQIMARYGNMSSPTVLFVLEQVLAAPPAAGSYGLLGALGPGFSNEQVLLQWA